MNLKERLDSINTIDKIYIKNTNNEEPDILDIFEDNTKVKKILSAAINNDKNIILLSDLSCNKPLLVKYISTFTEQTKKSMEITSYSDINDKHPPDIYVFIQPSVYEIVKIFERVMYGYKSFIFTMNMNSFDNILEKLKTVIAVNFNNLTSDNIDLLISNSNSVMVYFSKNEDGLFTITNIAEITNENNNMEIVSLYSAEPNDIQKIDKSISVEFEPEIKKEITINEEENEPVQEIHQDGKVTYEVNNELKTGYMDNDDISVNEPQTSLVEEEKSIPVKKINKYKLLKEKVKNKRQS